MNIVEEVRLLESLAPKILGFHLPQRVLHIINNEIRINVIVLYRGNCLRLAILPWVTISSIESYCLQTLNIPRNFRVLQSILILRSSNTTWFPITLEGDVLTTYGCKDHAVLRFKTMIIQDGRNSTDELYTGIGPKWEHMTGPMWKSILSAPVL